MQIRCAIDLLRARKLFAKVAAGRFPHAPQAVREAMEKVDPIVSSSPVKNVSNKRKVREETQAEEEVDEVQPPCKSHRAT